MHKKFIYKDILHYCDRIDVKKVLRGYWVFNMLMHALKLNKVLVIYKLSACIIFSNILYQTISLKINVPNLIHIFRNHDV